MLNVSLIKSYQETNNEKYFNDSREHADPIKDISMTHEPLKKKINKKLEIWFYYYKKDNSCFPHKRMLGTAMDTRVARYYSPSY